MKCISFYPTIIFFLSDHHRKFSAVSEGQIFDCQSLHLSICILTVHGYNQWISIPFRYLQVASRRPLKRQQLILPDPPELSRSKVANMIHNLSQTYCYTVFIDDAHFIDNIRCVVLILIIIDFKQYLHSCYTFCKVSFIRSILFNAFIPS